MKRIGMVVAALALASSGSALGQQAVQWRVEDGGNGHWYRLESVPDGLTWESARERCLQAGGHLATITSHGEQALLATLTSSIPGHGVSPVRGWGPWIGGYQQSADGEPASGWRWVTGESWDVALWTDGQPDNLCVETGEFENFLSIHSDQGQTWNDLPQDGCDGDRVVAYWIEFSADCNGDGIVDYGQILQGQLADNDSNGIPDVCETDPCPGDVSGGGAVDSIDLAIVLAAWGTDGQGKFDADTNNDGTVDALDLAQVLSDWGPCPE